MVMKILLLEAGWRQGCAVGRPSRELQFLQDLSSAPSPSRQPPPRAGKHSVRGRQSLVLALRWGCPVTLCSFTSAWKTRGLPPDSRGARKAASVAWLSSMELLVDPVSGRAEHCLGVRTNGELALLWYVGSPKGVGPYSQANLSCCSSACMAACQRASGLSYADRQICARSSCVTVLAPLPAPGCSVWLRAPRQPWGRRRR